MRPEARRFASTVPFYSRYRLGYPPRLIERVIALTGLNPGDAVLDLGAGPGLLAIPFAVAGMRVTAADPQPAMLDAAREAAAAARVTLSFWSGGSEELTPEMGPFRLVTMGRSFHWMNRAATLAMLDRLILPGGAIALFHDEHPETVENGWLKVLRELRNRYGPTDEPHIAERKSPHYRTHESYLLDSAFCKLDGVTVVIRKRVTVDEIVGRALSMSSCSPEKLGACREAFESELRARLATRDELTEIAALVALVARRP